MWQRIGSAFLEARRARDPKRIVKALQGVPEPVLNAAKRQGIAWRMDAHPIDCVEDPKLIIACLGEHFLDLGPSVTTTQSSRFEAELKTMFGGGKAEVEELVELLKWLVNQLGGSKAHGLAKRLDELADMDGFLRLMPFLQRLLTQGWNAAQIEALSDVKKVFDI